VKENVNPWLVLNIKQWCLPALLDSGSSRSFLRKDVFEKMKQLNLVLSVQSANGRYVIAGGQSCEVKEAGICNIKIQSFSWKLKFLVFDHCPVPCLLGTDFMSLANMKLNFGNSCYSFGFEPS
jgi:hypothetical protein